MDVTRGALVMVPIVVFQAEQPCQCFIAFPPTSSNPPLTMLSFGSSLLSVLVERHQCHHDGTSKGLAEQYEPARFTSRPESRGSGVEAVFRFLGSGVDFF